MCKKTGQKIIVIVGRRRRKPVSELTLLSSFYSWILRRTMREDRKGKMLGKDEEEMQVLRTEVIEGHCMYETTSLELITLTINMC